MEISLHRNEKLIALFAVGAALAFTVMFLQISSKSGPSVSKIDTRSQINYQMARPEEGYSEYSLNGREVDQVYEGTTKKKELNHITSNKAKVQKPKTEEAKKALAQTQSNANARAAYNAAQSKRLADAQARGPRSIESKAKEGESNHSNNENVNQANQQRVDANTPAPAADAKVAKKKTFAEWRSLVFAQPTRETINQFLDAYRKSEVTQTEMQALAQDLLDQSDDKLKGLGLYALRATPSLASLSQLVHIEADMSATYKTYIDQAYLAYLQPQNVSYLNQALQTKDKAVILKSLNLLGVNLQNLAKGDYSSLIDPRNRRDSTTVTEFSIVPFKTLIPALTTLGASQDQEVAPLALQIVSYIQSTNNVASN